MQWEVSYTPYDGETAEAEDERKPYEAAQEGAG